MHARRINLYDVIIENASKQFVKALRQAGLKVFRLQGKSYQVSFSGHPDLIKALPPVGTEYEIKGA